MRMSLHLTIIGVTITCNKRYEENIFIIIIISGFTLSNNNQIFKQTIYWWRRESRYTWENVNLVPTCSALNDLVINWLVRVIILSNFKIITKARVRKSPKCKQKACFVNSFNRVLVAKDQNTFYTPRPWFQSKVQCNSKRVNNINFFCRMIVSHTPQ